MTNITKMDRVLNALQAGEHLTKRQIKARFDVANPRATISDLRMKGFSIHLREHKTKKGNITLKYQLGKTPRYVIAAGYQYLAMMRQAG
jgi:hypothetical protein